MRAVFERCLSDRRTVEVAFLSRRTGELMMRQCVPIASERALLGAADAGLYHFLHTNHESGTTHPLSLMPERILYISPVPDEA